MKKEIAFGIFINPLSKQLKGMGIPALALKQFDNDDNAINRLMIRGLLTEKQVDSARKKLLKRIEGIIPWQKENSR